MISVIPALYRYLGGILILALVVGGIYFKGRSDGKEVVQAELDAQRATWQQQFDKQSADTARIEEQRDQLTWRIENELQPKLAAVTAGADDLAGKLRQYTRRRVCAVSEAAGSTAVPDSAGRVPSDSDPVEAALGDHIAACARDAERLTGWQEFYEALRLAQ